MKIPMQLSQGFPLFDERLPFLNQFTLDLAENFNAGKIALWSDLDERVKYFFTTERMIEVEAAIPGWKKMASYSGGVTLTHVICVFLGLLLLPEFQSLTYHQQQLAKWIVLFHDVEKVHINGKRDHTHAFRSAITAAKALKDIGFATTNQYTDVFEAWQELTLSAITDSTTQPAEIISDNSKLPEIIQGVEKMYGRNMPASLIVKGVLLHMSINAVKDWPQPAPLSGNEIVQYVDNELLPLLKVMHLADNEGWSMFEPETRAIQRSETLEAFEKVERLTHRQETVSSSNAGGL